MEKAVFLDRDGTINVDKHYVYKAEDFEFISGALEALCMLQAKGYLLIIISNQSGIARGFYQEKDYEELTKWLDKELLDRGIKITKYLFCPHFPHGEMKEYAIHCKCRKPETGLFYQAAQELNIAFDDSYAIGDKIRDLSICYETGTKGILLSGNDRNIDQETIVVKPDLLRAAEYICSKSGEKNQNEY